MNVELLNDTCFENMQNNFKMQYQGSQFLNNFYTYMYLNCRNIKYI